MGAGSGGAPPPQFSVFKARTCAAPPRSVPLSVWSTSMRWRLIVQSREWSVAEGAHSWTSSETRGVVWVRVTDTVPSAAVIGWLSAVQLVGPVERAVPMKLADCVPVASGDTEDPPQPPPADRAATRSHRRTLTPALAEFMRPGWHTAKAAGHRNRAHPQVWMASKTVDG